MYDFIQYFIQNSSEIFSAIWQHLQLTLLSVCISILIGVPLGILISFLKIFTKPVIGFANIMQAIPSLALLGFLIPVLGIGTSPAIFMVVIYSLLPIIKNTSISLNNISRETIEAAKGIGMKKMQILMRVKLPLALPVIMAGVRISAVTAVGLVTIAAFIGAGGLGYLVYAGIRTVNTNQILAGAIPACLMALIIDFLASLVEKAVTPVSFTSQAKTADKTSIGRFKRKRKVTLVITSIFLAFVLVFSTVSHFQKDDKSIVIGGKDYTEQNLLANIYAELIEANTDISVIRQFDLGGTQIVFNAMTNDELDMYVEYTGTAYGNILGHTEDRSSQEVYDIVKSEFQEKYNLTMLEPLGFNNTYTLSIRKDTAEKYNLKTISDLASVSSQLIATATIEFQNREDGLPGLMKAYNMNFKDIVAIDGTPRYTALDTDAGQVTDAFSTDGLLLEFGLVNLEDDKEFFPPYYAAPLVRPDVLKRYPELENYFNILAGSLDDASMQALNYKVDVLKMAPRDVAIEFLKERNLIE